MHASSIKDGKAEFDGAFAMRPDFSAAVRGRPVVVPVSVFLSPFGQASEVAAAMGEKPVDTLDDLRCYRDYLRRDLDITDALGLRRSRDSLPDWESAGSPPVPVTFTA